ALLPMKGNSERVPNKNIKPFSGKPLYHRVLNTLLNSQYVNDVIINTDCQKLKEDISKNFSTRVKIHDRPEAIQGDYVSMNKIIEYDINNIESDLFVQTHSTNPLLTCDSLDNAIKKMIEFQTTKLFDSVFSVTKIQTRFYNSNGSPHNHNPDELLRTQDLPILYEENSNFYIFTKESFMKNSGR